MVEGSGCSITIGLKKSGACGVGVGFGRGDVMFFDTDGMKV
jgi:hypothetical protein